MKISNVFQQLSAKLWRNWILLFRGNIVRLLLMGYRKPKIRSTRFRILDPMVELCSLKITPKIYNCLHLLTFKVFFSLFFNLDNLIFFWFLFFPFLLFFFILLRRGIYCRRGHACSFIVKCSELISEFQLFSIGNHPCLAARGQEVGGFTHLPRELWQDCITWRSHARKWELKFKSILRTQLN